MTSDCPLHSMLQASLQPDLLDERRAYRYAGTTASTVSTLLVPVLGTRHHGWATPYIHSIMLTTVSFLLRS
jgi:hypothetical protein